MLTILKGRRQQKKFVRRVASVLIVAGMLLTLYSFTLAVYYTDALRLFGADNWGWTNGPYGEGTYVLDLYAGAAQNDLTKGRKVGTVTVVYLDGEVTVTYHVTGGAYLTEAHLYIGTAPLPFVRRGDRLEYTHAPGLFPYNSGELATGTSTYTFGPYQYAGEIYVAAHAVVCYQAGYTGGDSIRVWLMQELVEAVPGPGGGDLFDQLVLTVQYEDTKLYQGPMSGFSEPLEMTGLIGSLVSGQVKEIDITIYLPGSETGNEYQGSFVKTSYSVLIQCAGANGSSENCTITLLPEDTLFSLGNLNPGDRYHRKLGFSITFMPSYSCETAWGYGGAKATPFPKEDREIIVMPSKADVSSDRVDKPAVPVPSEIVINPVRPEVHKLSGERHPLPQTGGNSALMGTIGVLMITMGIWLRRKSRN